MIEEFKSDGWRDFSQRYIGTFGWFEKQNGEKLLVKLMSCNDSSLVFSDEKKMEYYAMPDSGNKFHFLPTLRGAYQYGDTVLVVERIPNRQWKRGVCADNTRIYDLETGRSLALTFENLSAIYGPKDDKVLLQWCKSGKGNVCLNNVFSIVRDTVYVYTNIIGYYSRIKQQVSLGSDMFKQELEDVFTRLKVDVLVEVAE